MKTIRNILVLALLATASSLSAQHKYSCSAEEIAFGGNDLVSYFSGDVLPGSEQFAYTYDGLQLYFANAANLNTFKADPDKYLPEYGGWCATAVSSNVYVKPDYNMFKIDNGDLFFFEVKAFYNGKTQWEKDPDIHEISADRNYRKKFSEE